MKKIIYITLSTLLGGMLSLLVHAGLEIPALALIERQLGEGGASWLSDNWWLVHDIGGAILTLLGLFFGYLGGKKFWRILYIEKRRGEVI